MLKTLAIAAAAAALSFHASYAAALPPAQPGSAAYALSLASQSNARLGEPLENLPEEPLLGFIEGADLFAKTFRLTDGLGPVFNGTSCAECHIQGAVGGAGFDLLISREVRAGKVVNGAFDPLSAEGGDVFQQRSVREIDATCTTGPEVIPGDATVVSDRITTPVFGDGLVEAIPDATILAGADPDDADGDGISGVANLVPNPDKPGDGLRVGRFGWKAQHALLRGFSGEAYRNEMGVTNPAFPDELTVNGAPAAAGCDIVDGLEDDGEDVLAFTNFMRTLAAPVPTASDNKVRKGAREFDNIGCASCHTPLMFTGALNPEWLANKPVAAFSDFLLHDVGTGDGIVQGLAKGEEFRTAPLWGLGSRLFYMHDGRATTIAQAIMAHDGEARSARDKFAALKGAHRRNILAFLGAL